MAILQPPLFTPKEAACFLKKIALEDKAKVRLSLDVLLRIQRATEVLNLYVIEPLYSLNEEHFLVLLDKLQSCYKFHEEKAGSVNSKAIANCEPPSNLIRQAIEDIQSYREGLQKVIKSAPLPAVSGFLPLAGYFPAIKSARASNILNDKLPGTYLIRERKGKKFQYCRGRGQLLEEDLLVISCISKSGRREDIDVWFSPHGYQIDIDTLEGPDYKYYATIGAITVDLGLNRPIADKDIEETMIKLAMRYINRNKRLVSGYYFRYPGIELLREEGAILETIFKRGDFFILAITAPGRRAQIPILPIHLERWAPDISTSFQFGRKNLFSL